MRHGLLLLIPLLLTGCTSLELFHVDGFRLELVGFHYHNDTYWERDDANATHTDPADAGDPGPAGGSGNPFVRE